MKRLIAALQFLTVCPFVSHIQCDERDIGRSTPWFPLVGLLIGGAVALLDRGMSGLFPPLLSSALAVVALLAASGGLHMDGLADTADGFLSSRPRERVLEIMRDSHTGAMGVIGIVCVFSLKVAALASTPPALRAPTLLLMPFAGRCSMVMQLALLPYARSGGLCSLFVQNGRRSDVVFTSLLFAAVSWLVGGLFGLTAAGISVAGIAIFSLWCRNKIGGFTGDTLGAGCEWVELIPALVAAAWVLK
ncbi:MAG: adenosylcobinamide-GDP ribazoletransferase [Verrucomicrobia bacterium]|nr:adenosylcobinamide-GDP ribazoletransferase [Verrucomicrobiota bacterium]